LSWQPLPYWRAACPHARPPAQTPPPPFVRSDCFSPSATITVAIETEPSYFSNVVVTMPAGSTSRRLVTAAALAWAWGVPCCHAQLPAGVSPSHFAPCAASAVPDRAYSLKLVPFIPGPGYPAGALLEVRID